MTRAQRERLRQLIDRAKRRRLQRATIATEADLRIWQEAERAERRDEGRAKARVVAEALARLEEAS